MTADSAAQRVSGHLVIAARPETIFDVLADPSRHGEFDGSGTVVGAQRSAPKRLELGSTFGMKMRLGIPYPMTNTVVEFEPNRRIAWSHFGAHRWRYQLEDLGEATRVTETFDWSTAIYPPIIEWLGWPRRHPANIAATLERLDALVSGT